MLTDRLETIITSGFQHNPTKGQQALIKAMSSFILDSENSIFIIKGYAGTGKTTIINSIVSALQKIQLKSVLLAPTGRAAKVLSGYSRKPAFTIHKKIYRQKSSNDGFGAFSIDDNLHTNTIFFVDEASMISNSPTETKSFGTGCILDDLIQYVYNGKNCKLVLIGDTAQLPPVHFDISPALDKEIINGYGKKLYYIELTDVVRQSQESGILHNATELRNLTNNDNFDFNDIKLSLKGFPDIKYITGGSLIEEIDDAYSQFGLEDTIVISRSNARANKFNQGIRNSILYRDEEIQSGDLLMVVKNNYHWAGKIDEISFIANGDIVEITKIHGHYEMYGYRYAEVTLKFMDYKELEIECMIMLDTLNLDGPSLSYDSMRDLYYKIAEDYTHIYSKKKKFETIKEDKFFNALQVKFSYSVTCHKAQGGQWKAVFVDQGYLTEEMLDKEYIRWLYTAFTRATEKLFLLNFNQKFFNEGEIDIYE